VICRLFSSSSSGKHHIVDLRQAFDLPNKSLGFEGTLRHATPYTRVVQHLVLPRTERFLPNREYSAPLTVWIGETPIQPMKPTLLKNVLITVALGLLCLAGPSTLKGKSLSHPLASAQGFLAVYLGSVASNEDSAWYFPRSFYSIYTPDGRLFRTITSQPSADDYVPDVVALPIGSYLIVGQSENNKQIRMPIVIRSGGRTTVDLDLSGRTLANE
jgi:hypothetical protein